MVNSKLQKLFGRAKNTATRHNMPESNDYLPGYFRGLANWGSWLKTALSERALEQI